MTDEEIEKEAKEYSQGNFYSEQGFLYGYERGFAEGREEKCNSCGLRQQKRVNLEKENAELKEHLQKSRDICLGEIRKVKGLRTQIEKMKNCSNCKHNNKVYNLCYFSGGDEDYFCRLRRWELSE